MRYAVYFCPAAGSALDVLGRQWLSAEDVPGIAPERLRALTTNVRRYGWHATLCAPFALAERMTYEDLHRIAADIAQQTSIIELPLHLDRLASFLALRPSGGEDDVKALADHCVRRLNPLRAPNSEGAWQRRIAQLDEVERALSREFGYPYVLDRYRFHMTIAAPASEAEEQAMRAWFASRLANPLIARVDALTLCCEKEPGHAFEQLEQIPLHAGNPV